MKVGVCTEVERAGQVHDAGFDFIEISVQKCLVPGQPADVSAPFLEAIRGAACPTLAANCLMPPDLKITGPERKPDELRQYVQTTFERAAQAGVLTIVFGSGGSRAVPDGFSRSAAYEQLLEFGAMAARAASAHGVTLAVEPLSRGDSNIFNTVAECGEYVQRVGHPHLKLLVDFFHWSRDDNDLKSLVEYGPLLRHAHIATRTSRRAPGGEACDFAPFFAALKEAGYDGTLSIECSFRDFEAEIRAGLVVLRECLAA